MSLKSIISNKKYKNIVIILLIVFLVFIVFKLPGYLKERKEKSLILRSAYELLKAPDQQPPVLTEEEMLKSAYDLLKSKDDEFATPPTEEEILRSAYELLKAPDSN